LENGSNRAAAALERKCEWELNHENTESENAESQTYDLEVGAPGVATISMHGCARIWGRGLREESCRLTLG
jgi:hypothetical protein